MSRPLSPTAVLPALATLHACGAARVREALAMLQDAYFPVVPMFERSLLSKTMLASRPKRTARLVQHDGVPDSGYASAEEDENGADEEVEEEEEEEASRDDALERGYAIRWLTGLVKRGDAWVSGAEEEEQTARAARLEDASRLVALFAGDAPEETVTRTFVFAASSSGREPITVQLDDAPVDGSDHTAVGLQSWGSAVVLAERLCLDPERYLLGPWGSDEARRVLELGAGTGLLSIVAARVLAQAGVRASIDATDYHPKVLANLARNVQLDPRAVGVCVVELDWRAEERSETGYDVVLGADVVYRPEHAGWIRGCVERRLGKDGVFWMIVPVRTTGRHEGMGSSVEEAFFAVGGDGSGSGKHLAIVGREDVRKVQGVGRADEGGYTLFEIRWV